MRVLNLLNWPNGRRWSARRAAAWPRLARRRVVHSRLLGILSISLYITIQPRFIVLCLYPSLQERIAINLNVSPFSTYSHLLSFCSSCPALHLLGVLPIRFQITIHPRLVFLRSFSQSRVEINPTLSPSLQALISAPFGLRHLLDIFSVSRPSGIASQIHARLVLPHLLFCPQIPTLTSILTFPSVLQAHILSPFDPRVLLAFFSVPDLQVSHY